MKNRITLKRFLLSIAFAMLMLTFMASSASANNKGPNMVSYAKKHVISGGQWTKNLKGIRYRRANNNYVKNTWCTINGKIYCFDQQGYVQTKSFRYGGKYYFADSQGSIYVNRWRKTGSYSYYYGKNGARVGGIWMKLNGKYYYFDRASGALVTNSWVGSYYVNRNGVRVTDKTISGRKLNKEGVIKKASKKDKYIIVGASRIVDMSTAVNSSNTIFIARGGQGIKWLKRTVMTQLTSYLKKNPNYKVIFQLGNNDLKKVNQYIRFYRYLITQYRNTDFYFLDVTPTTSNLTNVRRVEFNNQMRKAFGNQCIDGYNYLMSTGYTTVDGVHYTNAVSVKLYNYIIQYVK